MLWDGPDEFAQPTAVVHDRCGACRDLGAPALGEQRLRQATPVGVDTQQKAVSGGFQTAYFTKGLCTWGLRHC